MARHWSRDSVEYILLCLELEERVRMESVIGGVGVAFEAFLVELCKGELSFSDGTCVFVNLMDGEA